MEVEVEEVANEKDLKLLNRLNISCDSEDDIPPNVLHVDDVFNILIMILVMMRLLYQLQGIPIVWFALLIHSIFLSYILFASFLILIFYI
jgi:hypothetical protein